jgi:hypothetical protein
MAWAIFAWAGSIHHLKSGQSICFWFDQCPTSASGAGCVIQNHDISQLMEEAPKWL